MEEKCKKIVEILGKQNKTISFMESCTGGFLANSITNISNASKVLKVSLVTYSSEYKIKFGVKKDIIDTYTVYSNQTSESMAKEITKIANSDIGVGVTGELGNTTNKNPKVYYTVYITSTSKIINNVIEVTARDRATMKKVVAKKIFDDILNELAN